MPDSANKISSQLTHECEPRDLHKQNLILQPLLPLNIDQLLATMEEETTQDKMEEEPTQQGISLSSNSLLPIAELLRLTSLRPRDTKTNSSSYAATQIVVDPRRLGQAGSGLSEEDLADVLCILHPASIPAYRATQLIHDRRPELTIATDRNVRMREKKHNGAQQDLDTFQLAEQGIDSHDLVLRLSSKVKDPAGGFYFGRNAQRCDFVIGHSDPSRRISNVHFKIYINEYGVMMLEDQSTNGTAVDGTLLRGKDKENNIKYRQTLENGTIIVLTMTPPEEDWRFFVRIPQREVDDDIDAYEKNLTTYFLRNNQARQAAQARIAAAENPTRGPTPADPQRGPTPLVRDGHILVSYMLTENRTCSQSSPLLMRPHKKVPTFPWVDDASRNGKVARSTTR